MKPTDWKTGTANCWRDWNSWTWSVCPYVWWLGCTAPVEMMLCLWNIIYISGCYLMSLLTGQCWDDKVRISATSSSLGLSVSWSTHPLVATVFAPGGRHLIWRSAVCVCVWSCSCQLTKRCMAMAWREHCENFEIVKTILSHTLLMTHHPVVVDTGRLCACECMNKPRLHVPGCSCCEFYLF